MPSSLFFKLRRSFFSGLILVALSLAFGGPAAVSCAAEDSGVSPAPAWKAEGITVFTVQDRPGSMSIDLFSGPATLEQRAQYFTDGKTPSSISSFLLRLGGKAVLVDAGYGDLGPGKSSFLESLAATGLKPEDIDLVLLSHMHTDHIGGLLLADGARRFPKARIHVSQPELEYWTGLHGKDPQNANAALAAKVMAAYGTDFAPPFALDKPLLPGLTPLSAIGHTPGHTVFLLESGGEKLLILGDLVHAASLQFPLPEECARYDMDREGAVAARKKILSLAADQGIPVVGMHLPYPGAKKVIRSGEGFALVE